MPRKYEILNIGSGTTHWNIKSKLGRKKNTFVEPFLHKIRHIEKLRLLFRTSELSTLTAHEFLDKAIRQKRSYKKIEIYMPLGGIASKKMNFSGLCKKMHLVLERNGQIEMLIDFHPEESKLGTNIGIFTESNPKKNYFQGNIQMPEDILPALKKAGFKVRVLRGKDIPKSVLNKSAASKVVSPQILTLLIATKK